MNDANFYSIDRLVEFGMGVAVAQQMINVMNQSMQSMYVPGTMNPVQQNPPLPPAAPPAAPGVYYVALQGKPAGPLNEQELSQLIIDGKVTKDTLAWMPGMAAWKAVQEVPAILRIVALMPPPLPQTDVQPKSEATGL